MKVINLDKFATVQIVSLGGKEYTVQGKPVEDFITDTVAKKLEAAKTSKDKCEVLISEVERISDIPRKVLVKQTFGVLNAILMVAQGVDPEKQQEAEGEDQKNE
jgi:hypothetical protein